MVTGVQTCALPILSLPTCPTCVYAKGICKKTGVEIRTTTGCSYHTPKPITNYDRLVSKSPEELAEWLGDKGTCPPGECTHMYDGVDCPECWLAWLRQEAE